VRPSSTCDVTIWMGGNQSKEISEVKSLSDIKRKLDRHWIVIERYIIINLISVFLIHPFVY